MKKHYGYWLVGGLCLEMSLVAFIVALAHPADGYEYSIYTSTPLAFWILVICSIAGGVILLVREAQNGVGGRWHFSLGILLLNGVGVLLLSVLRNYYSVGADTLMHVGYVKDLSQGIVSAQNAYPAVHVPPTLLVWLGVSPLLATSLSPVFWYGIYTASFYGLANELWENRRMIIISMVLAVALLLPMGVGFTATLASTAMFPLTLLVLLRLRREFNVKNIILLVILLGILSLLHPMALEVLLISLGVLFLLSSANRWKLLATTVILLPVVVWWYWHWFDMNLFGSFLQDLFASSITPTANQAWTNPVLPSEVAQMAENGGYSLLPSVVGIQATQTASQYGFISLILRRYGFEILLGLLAIVVLVVGMKKYWRNSTFTYFGSLFVIFNAMWVGGWYLTLSKYDLALSRMLNWVPIVSIILIVPLLVRMLESRIVLKSVAVAILLAVLCGALFHVYSSPFIGTPNMQITYQQVKGIDWLLDNGVDGIPIVHLNKNERVSRFVAARYGVEWVRNNQTKYWLNEYRGVLDDFEYYVGGGSIGWQFSEDVYLVVTKLDKSLPRWEEDKLYILSSDPAVELVYRDGDEFEVWFVRSLEENPNG